MSDASQGPGWWQASDGKWYPPEAAPGGQPSGSAPATFDIGAALGYGWNKFVQYIGQIIVILLIIFAVQIAFFFFRTIITNSIDSFFLGFIIGMLLLAVGFFISFLLQAGLIRAGLAITRGEAPEPSMLFDTTNLGPFAVASIFVALLAFVGLLACCVGYIAVALFTLFYGYYVIDKQQEPTESIGSSFNLVKDNFGSVLGFAVIVVILNIITCGLAIGVTQIATAYAYKTLNGEPVVD